MFFLRKLPAFFFIFLFAFPLHSLGGSFADDFLSLLSDSPSSFTDEKLLLIKNHSFIARNFLLRKVVVRNQDDGTFSSKSVIEIIRPEFKFNSSAGVSLKNDDFGFDDFDEDFSFNGQKILDMLEKDNGKKQLIEEDFEREKVFSDSDGSLRNFLFDGESFSVSHTGDDTVYTDSFGSKIVRRTYDKTLRMILSETYQTASSASEYSLKKEKKFFYDSDSYILLRTVENFIDDKIIQETQYLPDGKISQITESKILDDESLRKNRQDSFVYDEKSRVLEKTTEIWAQKDGEEPGRNSGKSRLEKTVRKTIYSYHDEFSNDGIYDFSYYENGTLRLKKECSSQDDYVQTTYFDGGFSVKVFYKNGVKTAEIIYFNNVEQRKRNFEQ